MLLVANFPDILNHILGIVFIIIIFSLAYAYLKPHQLHKRRLVSTLLLKSSYLLYLLVLLIIIYFSALVKGGLETVFMGIEFFCLSGCSFRTYHRDICPKTGTIQEEKRRL